MAPLPIVLDIPNHFAAIPGSGNAPVAFTHTFDVAKYVVALQSLSTWEKESFIIGDKLTWNEFLGIAEQVTGSEFTVVHDSLDTLATGHITELPAHRQVYPFFPKEVLQSLFAAIGRMFEQGAFNLEVKGSLRERFPEITPRSVRELVKEAYGGHE